MLKNITKLQPGIQCFEIESENTGDNLTVRVQLPGSYEFSDSSYPVLYVLDGDAAFGLATTIMSYINLGANFGMGKNIPEMIVVSIGYERGGIPWLLTRVRDFTPTEDPSFNYNNPNFNVPASGKAELFYNFILDELNPELESMFRIDPSLNVLATHSMGGVFAAYTMLNQKQYFNKFLMVSPFVGWDSKAVFGMMNSCKDKNKKLNSDVFISCTPVEPTPSYIEEVSDFYENLVNCGFEGLNCHFENYPDDNHFSVISKAFIDGLVYLFNAV